MPSFSYKAVSQSGADVSGVMEAQDIDAVRNALVSQGYIPSKIAPKSGDLLEDLSMRLTAVTMPELILFTKQFRTLFRAGVSVMSMMEVMEQQTENKKLKNVVVSMSNDIQSGMSLYESFAKHPKIFSQLYCSMIRAGEASGRLPEVMERLISLLQHEFKIKSDIKSALQYPITVVIALAIAFFVLLTFVIPKFADIFRAAGLDLPWPTQACIWMYEFLANYWYLAILIVVGTTTAIWLYVRTEHGHLFKDKLLLKIPVLGPVFRKAAMSRFASIFAILQESGVSILDTMDILSSTIGNYAISKEFNRLQDRLKEGKGISGPLRSAKFFTPMVINMIAIGEESGNLDEMLKEISKHYDDEVAYAVDRMSQALGPILIVGLAGVVGFFAMAIFLPMWDLTKTVQ